MGAIDGEPLHLLLVEDDPGDAFLVQEQLKESDLVAEVEWAHSVAEALPRLEQADCVLLDLGLPDSFGLDGLHKILAAWRGVAVIVLTGLSDRSRGVEALTAGAQDYLVKAEVDASLLGRSVRYAIERRRADEATRRLYEADMERAANERIQRGLLPRPLLRDPTVRWSNFYRPGGGGHGLGGDFYDAVELEDGTLRLVIGDVSGHGPDEAVLGVSLRIAWRTLVMAGALDQFVLPALDDVLVSERLHEESFVTVCDVSVRPGRDEAVMRLAGHPPPLVLGAVPEIWEPALTSPPIGVLSGAVWPDDTISLPADWALLLYTDGLIEGRAGEPGAEPGERLGLERLVDHLAGSGHSGKSPPSLDHLLEWAEERHGGPLPDDVALFLLSGAA